MKWSKLKLFILKEAIIKKIIKDLQLWFQLIYILVIFFFFFNWGIIDIFYLED